MTRERRIYAERQKPSLTPAQVDVERLRFGTWRAEMMSSSSICCFEPLGFIGDYLEDGGSGRGICCPHRGRDMAIQLQDRSQQQFP